jgi:hypothetical protein
MAQISLPEPPDFLGCGELSEMTLALPGPTRVRAVRAWFRGSVESEAWNSWLRACRLPPPGSLSVLGDGQLLFTRELRFPAALPPAGLLPSGDVTLIELCCDERELSFVTLRFPPGPFGLAHLEVSAAAFSGAPWPEGGALYAASPARAQPDLPRLGDRLAEELIQNLARRGRSALPPTLPELWELALPYRGGALLGIPEGPIAYQLWNGALVLRPEGRPWPAAAGDRVLLQLYQDGQPLLAATAHSQKLGSGYLPVGEVQLDAGALQLQESAWVDNRGELRLWLLFCNRSSQTITLELRAVAARRLAAKNAALYAEVHTPLGCRIEKGTGDDAPCLRIAASPAAVAFPLAAQEQVELTLRLPLEKPAGFSVHSTASAAASTPAADSDAFLTAGAGLELPDAHLHRLWRALLLHTRLFIRDGVMRYGLFPGVYEDALFGVEEGWNIVALAQYGHAATAMQTLERTFFTPEFLKKEGPHHQYRNGLAITYALDVYALSSELELLRRLWPALRLSAEWIAASFASTRMLVAGQRPPHYGLMPKHIYGGDLRRPAYSLYASSACWRGLRDAARVATLLGEGAAAARFYAEAKTARADIYTAAERIFVATGTPPYLPFATDETGDTPGSGEYYQLFASLILETAVFGWRSRFALLLTDYLEKTGRKVLGLPRFDAWFGRLGIDAEYARGCQLAALHRREFASFYLTMLGQIGLSCDPHTFVSPETLIVRFTDQEQRDRLRVLGTQATRADSDPCSAGTGVMLQYLRQLLVTEERDEDDLPTGTLWLAAAAPAAWFLPGQSFAVAKLPTAFGPLSYRCRTDEKNVVYEIEAKSPVDIEAFFCDGAGQRRSVRARAEGMTRLSLPRS